MKFEIHVTADERIHDMAARVGFRTIIVDLLRPDRSGLRTEHMTSQVITCDDFEHAIIIANSHADYLMQTGCRPVRVKVESPYLPELVDVSCYIESHFDWHTEMRNGLPVSYPLSRNQKKSSIMGTDREYDKAAYPAFLERWYGRIIELCVYDSFVEEDADWFALYNDKPVLA